MEENNNKQDDQQIENLKDLIRRAIYDEDFRTKLTTQIDEVLKDYPDVSEITKITLRSLDAEDFEKLTAENVEEFFSTESAVYTPDIEETMETVEYPEAEEDDF